MDFKDQIKILGERVAKLKDQILTEEATKNAFIMPFLQTLGYDVFNPFEVHPEYISDIGTKKGEKIDYAIMKDGNPVILVECKHWGQNLDLHDGQLLRYFHVSKAKFGILTNGIVYRFYTDLVSPNKMDEKPFFELNITDARENQVEELKKFHKSYFDITSITTTAEELKYTNELKLLLNKELTSPSELFVKHFAKQVYPGVVTQKILDQFTQLLRKSSNQYISDLITERLKSALDKETDTNVDQPSQQTDSIQNRDTEIVTTQEELEAFMIIRAICRQKVDVSRITHRDALSYFAVLFDDNNRKPICRLYLNSKKKFLGIFNDEKIESKIEIKSIDEIYSHNETVLKSIEKYLDTQ